MEKWKITAENSSIANMDISQISELATAIMDTWASSSAPDHLLQGHPLSGQGFGGLPSSAPDHHHQIPLAKVAGVFAAKQEVGDDFPGVLPLQNFLQQQQGALSPEQVPMDDVDPLESFTFWDGENFYCHSDAYDACTTPSASDVVQMDTVLAPLPEEYVRDDDMTRDETFPIKDTEFLNNPTLAELNSCGETFDFAAAAASSFLGAEDSGSFQLLNDSGLSRSFQTATPDSHFVASPAGSSYASSSYGFIDIIHKPHQQAAPLLSSSCPAPSRLVPPPQQQHFLGPREDKYPLCPQNSPASDSLFALSRRPLESSSPRSSPLTAAAAPTPPLLVAQSNRLQDASLLSSSAPPDVTMASYFKKIKTEPPSGSPGPPRSITERSLSGFSSLSLSNDDESGSLFDDEDEEEDFSSDEDVYQYESDDLLSTSWPGGKDDKSCAQQQHRKHRYFWQYNLQSRGSKTQSLLPRIETGDPHVLNDAFDPVFSVECALPVKHSGKARRGDGNDLTPDPRKLYSIGMELKKLNKLIYNIGPAEGGGHGKSLSRKEKNKLASRVCRLKKKAQHEANKIKLYGLQYEHKKLISILVETKELLKYKIENLHDRKVSNCSKKLETFLATNEPHKVAGCAASFVNEVLDNVAKGESDGGLSRL